MEVYRYKAMDAEGRITIGRVDAVNPADLEVRLSRMGLDLINFRELRRRQKNITGRGIKRADLITFTFHLEHLMNAGVPILAALADLKDTVANRRLREVTAALIESIEGGQNLSGAMGQFPYVFSPVMVSLVRAGEQSGTLSTVLKRITENLKWQDEQAANVRRVMTYPAITALVVLGVLFFLMTYVVPELILFVESMGQALPLHTRALINTSDFLTVWWWLVLSLPVALFLMLAALYRSNEAFQLRMDALKLRLPVVGPILKKIIMTRFANFFAMMYASGITVLDCLRQSEEIVGNRAVRAAVATAGRSIADGGGISKSFADTGLFPPLVVRMLRVGENTGALEDALMNVSYFYARDVDESVAQLQTSIVPAMTIILAALLGWIALSVLGPIYDIITTIDI